MSSASVTIKTIDNDNNTRSYTVKNESYQQQAYQGQPDYQYQGHQGNYYSQYYRPSRVLLPSAQTSSPAEMLEYSIKKVLNFLARPQENASLEQITYFLKQEITPHFDFEYMARWVAGRYYRLMSPEQQMQFTETFSELFITTFVQKLSNYQNYPPVVDGFRSKRTSENEALASARIMRENGGSVQVDFKFLKTPRGWKVVDVKANGVSALFYYRNFFNEQIRKRSQQQQVFK
ncbi:MlaC/ttg2D family ABC transporter substrate-binding protein [sulfur-oxidizing endosymbiont of Gigantopelta aegis]|uniref:MlaC/ttg2D family ABC transporter substrate-binding protein n=1 Tax=sulfur-oxidizing endosymbiont of Gigantopelta aegis TaxID=2794934 RepID=UPI0018DB3AB8|nr:ABC transporter substrate-binding protein [sulfur-oxidizing endosymbiont of Gigantopelta aegis]